MHCVIYHGLQLCRVLLISKLRPSGIGRCRVLFAERDGCEMKRENAWDVIPRAEIIGLEQGLVFRDIRISRSGDG